MITHHKETEYRKWLQAMKERIAASRIKAALSVNRELIELYWFLGSQIIEKQKTAKWGSSFIENLSQDLKEEFPDMAGFSSKNLRYCRAFYHFYSDTEIWQQCVAKKENIVEFEKWQQVVAKIDNTSIDDYVPDITGQIPWGHIFIFLQKLKAWTKHSSISNRRLKTAGVVM